MKIWIGGKTSTDICEIDSDALLEYYCNAAATGCRCGGHHKSDRNDSRCKQFAAELKSRGIEVPGYFDAAEQGKYNGPGSY